MSANSLALWFAPQPPLLAQATYEQLGNRGRDLQSGVPKVTKNSDPPPSRGRHQAAPPWRSAI